MNIKNEDMYRASYEERGAEFPSIYSIFYAIPKRLTFPESSCVHQTALWTLGCSFWDDPSLAPFSALLPSQKNGNEAENSMLSLPGNSPAPRSHSFQETTGKKHIVGVHPESPHWNKRHSCHPRNYKGFGSSVSENEKRPICIFCYLTQSFLKSLGVNILALGFSTALPFSERVAGKRGKCGEPLLEG